MKTSCPASIIKPFQSATSAPLRLDRRLACRATDGGAKVQGFPADRRGQTEIYRGAEYLVSFLPRLRSENRVDDGQEFPSAPSRPFQKAAPYRQDRPTGTIFRHPGPSRRLRIPQPEKPASNRASEAKRRAISGKTGRRSPGPP